MKSRDPQWVKRFVHGQWGISEATLHQVLPDSIIDPPKEWIDHLIKSATLTRSFDHGETSPACMLWWAAYKDYYVCFREYYQDRTLVSEHRRNISDLGGDETYQYSVADPAIFKVQNQKYGGFWCTSDEYTDRNLNAPPIHFIPGDNNELTTRNRVNEYLRLHDEIKHPLTHVSPAPKIYFVTLNAENHNYGCFHAIQQLRNQRRIKLGTINGRDIYGQERDDKITDHAYDTVRYYIASHAGFKSAPKRKFSESSFEGARRRVKLVKQTGLYNRYGNFRPRGVYQ